MRLCSHSHRSEATQCRFFFFPPDLHIVNYVNSPQKKEEVWHGSLGSAEDLPLCTGGSSWSSSGAPPLCFSVGAEVADLGSDLRRRLEVDIAKGSSAVFLSGAEVAAQRPAQEARVQSTGGTCTSSYVQYMGGSCRW